MSVEFEYEKKKVFSMRKFLKFYSMVFGVLIALTIVIYNLSLQFIFGDREPIETEAVLGEQTSNQIKKNTNTIIINPKRAKEEDPERLELSNGILADKLFLFDNENHSVLEGETIADHIVAFSMGEYSTSKQSNPDGFFSLELPTSLAQFQMAEIQIKNKDLQLITNLKFILILKKHDNRIYFINPQNQTVFSIRSMPGYKSSVMDFDAVDNTICKLENVPNKAISSLQDPPEGVIVYPSPPLLEDITSKKVAIFEIKPANPVIEQAKCIEEIENTDLQIEWHNEDIQPLLTQLNLPPTPPVPISDPVN